MDGKNLSGSVSFIGYIYKDDILSIFNVSAVFILKLSHFDKDGTIATKILKLNIFIGNRISSIRELHDVSLQRILRQTYLR